jgi:LAO/AO transport system kinase
MPEGPDYYVKGVLANNMPVLSKTITLIESSLPAHKKLARTVVDRLLPHSGKAVRLGITGVPGVGKSTFIESLGMMLVHQKKKVAVLTVDPSSQRSGGSVLADKTRMEKLAVEKKAYIRPSPAGSTLGGVASKTRETILVCEAAGFDVMIVETVGVGQSETTVASMVDFFLVLMLSGAGDELQGIKKGILEIADAIAINKADGDNIKKADIARKQYETALHLLSPSSPNWSPPVLTCSALEMAGIDDIWNCVLDHKKKLTDSGELKIKQKQQDLDWMWSLVEDGLKEWFKKNPEIKIQLPGIIRAVKNGETAPTTAANTLLFSLDNIMLI